MADVRNSAVLNIDKTIWRENGGKASLFVFIHHEGVPPTSNAAEQAVRKSVIFRKLSFGAEAKSGSRNMAVILSVVETCRRLGSRPLDYIHKAVPAAFSHMSAPELMPTD